MSRLRVRVLDLRLPTYDADQQINQGAFVVVQMMSARFVGLQENLWYLLLLSESFVRARLSPSLMASLVATLLPQFPHFFALPQLHKA